MLRPCISSLAAGLYVICATVAFAADQSSELRPYVTLHLGRAIFTEQDSASGIDLDTPSDEPVLGGSIGVDWGRYLGAELSTDFVETSLDDPNDGPVGEYAMWTLLAQLRLRYPLLEDRLVPYLLLGGGLGTGEFNDRKIDRSDFSIGGAFDTSPVAAVGGGLEYFVAPNLALGLEAKHRFLFNTDVKVGEQTRELNFDSTIFTAGLRVYLSGTDATGPAGPPPADTDALRGYLALRAGGAVFTSTDSAGSVELGGFGAPAGAAAIGLNLNKYLGLELAVETVETELDAPGLGMVGEYTMVAATGQVRLRYPVMDDRLTPYLILGGGMGFGELNDRKLSNQQIQYSDSRAYSPLATAGAGLEYFIAENVAVGVEAKHFFLFDVEAEVNGQKTDVALDSVFVSFGLRIFFP